jgi:regulator of sigma E protease
MQGLGGILLAVLILLIMVTIHEFGHFLAGKALGFKITEFSVGFGPAIFKKRSKKTGELFALRCIPLGGYCAFDGEDWEDEEEPTQKTDEGEQTEITEPLFAEFDSQANAESQTADNANESATNEPTVAQSEPLENEKQEEFVYPEPKGKKFNEQPPWKRIIVLAAGAIMNYLLALVFLIIMTASYGVPMCMVMPHEFKNDRDMVVPHASWETSTLSGRDILLSIDGTPIDMYTDCIDALEGKTQGQSVTARVLRYKSADEGWQEKEVQLILGADGTFKDIADVDTLSKAMGLDVYTTTLKRDFWHTIGGAFDYSFEMGTAVLRSLGELLTGGLGLDAMGGPITTITTTAQAASASPFSFLYMASFIGVNLAVFNLLPVPALDGCKIIFCLIEWIFKKPVNRKVETIIHFVGIIVLFGFAILVDLLQLFG